MIEINNSTKVKINRNFLKKAAEKILKKEKKSLKISIALVGPGKIKKLNRKYRKKNKITDILSFLYDHSGEINKFDSSVSAAELIICPQQIKKNARKFDTNFKKELTRVLIHGVLHLLGEDHEVSKRKAKQMERKQEYYLNLFLKLF